MKKICVCALCLMLLIGCRESPERDIIVNKNDDKLEKSIAEQPSDCDKAISIEKKKDEFFVLTGDVEVQVNAKVVPIENALPVVKVIPHEITSEDLKRWGDVLFAGETVYNPGVPKTKKEMEEEILLWKQMLADRKEEGDESIIEYYEETIANLEAAYINAPDTVDKILKDYVFHPAEYYLDEGYTITPGDSIEKDMTFEAVTDYKDGIRKEILATNRNETDYSMHALAYFESLLNEDVLKPFKACTEEEALALAEQTKEQLGIKDWILVNYSKTPNESTCRHQFEYTRYYENVPVLKGYGIDLHSEDLYAANLYYEEFFIVVENGEVTEVSWYSPMDIIEVENNNVKTLPFDKIYECFKNQVQSQYSHNTFVEHGYLTEDDEVENKIKLSFSNIEEGMFRIKVKDSSEEFRMVPAWLFKGTIIIDGYAVGEETVVINAIDGSVINPTLGY